MSTPNLYGAITSHLLADAGMTALIGGRAYPVERPENETGTAVVFSVVSDTQQFETGEEPDGIPDMRVQFECLASDRFATAHAIYVALVLAMKSFRGTQANGAEIQGNRRESFFDNSELDGQQKLYRITADYMIFYRED